MRFYLLQGNKKTKSLPVTVFNSGKAHIRESPDAAFGRRVK